MGSGSPEIFSEITSPPDQNGKAAPSRLVSVFGWARKGFWAVLDQGLFSGSSFLVNILLARWLMPNEYGAFAVALSIFYLLASFHTAVLTEPMMVFGAGKYREHFHKYLGMLLYGHWGISAIVALALGIAALVFAHYGSLAMARALAGLAIASPFLLLIWLVRRACYVPMKPVWATVGSGVNLAVTLAGLFLLWRAGLLSSLSGLVLLGGAAAIASLALMVLRLRPRVWGFAGNPTPTMVLGDHWGYGRWGIGTAFFSTLSLNLYFLLLPFLLSLKDLAALRALYNLVTPAQQLLNALSPLVLVWLSRQGPSSIRSTTLRSAVILGGLSLIFLLGLAACGKEIISLLYESKYLQVADYVFLVGLYPFITSQSIVFGNALRAMGRIDKVMVSYIVASVAFLGGAIPLVLVLRLAGAVLGILVYGFVLIAMLLLLWRQAT